MNPRGVPERRAAVLAALPGTAREISQKSGISETGCRHFLERLVSAGKVEKLPGHGMGASRAATYRRK